MTASLRGEEGGRWGENAKMFDGGKKRYQGRWSIERHTIPVLSGPCDSSIFFFGVIQEKETFVFCRQPAYTFPLLCFSSPRHWAHPPSLVYLPPSPKERVANDPMAEASNQ